MSRWFRFYDDSLNNPKVQKLPAELFRHWVNLLCLASKGDGAFVREDVAFALRCRDDEAESIVTQLIGRNLLEDRGDFLTPHDWDERQFKSDDSGDRVKRHREKNKKRDCNVTDAVTVTVTPSVTVTPPEQSRTDSAPKRAHLFEVPPKAQTEDAELFERGKSVLGQNSGALIARLLRFKKGNVALARSAIEQASTKENPREYIGRILAGPAVANERHGVNDPLAGII